MVLSESHKQYIDAVAWFVKDSSSIPKHVWAMSTTMKKYFPSIKE